MSLFTLDFCGGAVDFVKCNGNHPKVDVGYCACNIDFLSYRGIKMTKPNGKKSHFIGKCTDDDIRKAAMLLRDSHVVSNGKFVAIINKRLCSQIESISKMYINTADNYYGFEVGDGETVRNAITRFTGVNFIELYPSYWIPHNIARMPMELDQCITDTRCIIMRFRRPDNTYVDNKLFITDVTNAIRNLNALSSQKPSEVPKPPTNKIGWLSRFNCFK